MNDLEKLIETYKANAIPYEKIDFSDSPELTKEDFNNGYFKYYKPRKKQVSIRLDVDVLEWLRKNRKWQTKINDILRKAKYQEAIITSNAKKETMQELVKNIGATNNCQFLDK